MKKPVWSKKKKIIVLSLGAVLAAGGALAGILLGGRGKVVEVVPVSQWTLGWMPNEMNLHGSISSDRSQQIFYDKKQTILEVLVSEGDVVKVGDPLLRYDATMDAIELELKQLQLQKLEYELADYWKSYQKYARKAYPSTLPSPSPTPTPTPRATRTPKPTKTPRPTATPDTAEGMASYGAGTGRFGGAHLFRAGALGIGGALFGSPDSPDVVITTGQKSFSSAELLGYFGAAKAANTPHYVKATGRDFVINMKFHVPSGTLNYGAGELDSTALPDAGGDGSQGNPYVFSGFAPGGVLLGIGTGFTEARLSDAGSGTCYVTLSGSGVRLDMNFAKVSATPIPTPTQSATPTPTPTVSPTPSVSPTPDPEDPGGGGGSGGMSREEREALARDYAKKIREAEHEYKQLKLDLQNLQLRSADGFIRAAIDGVVGKVNDPAELADGELLLSVKGSEGFYVRCIVGELDLNKISVGTELTGFSYDSGMNCTGRVVEVGSVPVTNRYYSGGNPNVSGYFVRIFIEDGTGLQAGQYVEFSMQSGAEEEDSTGALYLHQAYVREMDGANYIFVARDGKLRQEKVETGRVMYGYVELVGSGLTGEDYIAFPYNKDVRDGAPVKLPNADEAYGG